MRKLLAVSVVALVLVVLAAFVWIAIVVSPITAVVALLMLCSMSWFLGAGVHAFLATCHERGAERRNEIAWYAAWPDAPPGRYQELLWEERHKHD